MENWQKGQIAEHKIIIRAMEKGLILSRPMVETVPYDFILDDGTTLQKVQVEMGQSETKKI